MNKLGRPKGSKNKFPLSDMDRFLSKIQIDSNLCWIWKARKNELGYGCFRLYNKIWLAHRASWKMFKGEIPKNIYVCHHCDNPSCVNPDHLFLGTNDDNMKDMVRKGRSAKGKNAGQSGTKNINGKLNEWDVIMLRRLYDDKIYSTKQLCDLFEITNRMVHLIGQRKSWSWLR